jgi:triphosphatase
VKAVERELKLEVPEAELVRVRAALAQAGSRPIAMRAIYFDTPQGHLRRAGIGLRLRREGGRWVQTLKAAGASALERLEDEVPLRARGERPPKLDVHRHAPEVVQLLLGALLPFGVGSAQLAPAYETRMRREVASVRRGMTGIELALDTGEIVAGGRKRPVRELEFELVEGDFAELLEEAAAWRSRHDLWISTASKAQRGSLLLAGEAHAAPARARAPVLGPKARLDEFASAVLRSCLDQVLANAGEVAAGSEQDEHIHQLRVGLRRLRTALREVPPLRAEGERFAPVLERVFRKLGERRDRAEVLRRITPLLEAERAPAVHLPEAAEAVDVGALVREPAFQDALMHLLARAESPAGGDARARRAMRPRLRKLYEQVVRDGRRFDQLDEPRQHRVRKRLKRLRYLAEFLQPVIGGKDLDRFLEALEPAQEALGRYNDGLVAQRLCQPLAGEQAGMALAVQWLAAQRPAEIRACRAALRKLAKVHTFRA